MLYGLMLYYAQQLTLYPNGLRSCPKHPVPTPRRKETSDAV
jgi:hypothetical protein